MIDEQKNPGSESSFTPMHQLEGSVPFCFSLYDLSGLTFINVCMQTYCVNVEIWKSTCLLERVGPGTSVCFLIPQLLLSNFYHAGIVSGSASVTVFGFQMFLKCKKWNHMDTLWRRSDMIWIYSTICHPPCRRPQHTHCRTTHTTHRCHQTFSNLKEETAVTSEVKGHTGAHEEKLLYCSLQPVCLSLFGQMQVFLLTVTFCDVSQHWRYS